MRSFLLILLTFTSLGLGFWTYRQNYETRDALKETHSIKSEIQLAVVRLNMLKAEWHYLNRPERLKALTDLNFQTLKLQPMRPPQLILQSELPSREGI